ncbi:hypothetical protein V8E51_016678 [Hyaloscypha variabilis]
MHERCSSKHPTHKPKHGLCLRPTPHLPYLERFNSAKNNVGGPDFSISSASLRIVLRAYFTTLLLCLSIIGNESCRQRVRYRVLKRQNFSLRDMTGWLNGFDGPWAIGPYVVEMQNAQMNLTIEPAPFGATYQMISQARLTSLRNGGLAGIYGKVNGDPSFRADPSDVVGQWKCQDSGPDIAFPVNASFESIYREFDSQQLVFTEYWSGCYDHHGDNVNGRFLLWTTSTPQPGDQFAKPWDVRAAVDMTTDAYAAQQVMRPFLCQMDAPSLDVILAQTSIDWWFLSWCEVVRGQIYTDFASGASTTTDPGAVLESVMDSLVITAGAAWNLTQFPISDPSQGCLVRRTQVSWVIAILFVLVTISTAAMTIYWITLIILVHRASRYRPAQEVKDIEEYTPNRLLSWMVQAVRETGLGEVRLEDFQGRI